MPALPVNLERRAYLAFVTALTGARWLPAARAMRGPRTRLILLGTSGGPRPRKLRSAPAQVIVANETAYVVDCGDGVARQLVLAGVALAGLRHIWGPATREVLSHLVPADDPLLSDQMWIDAASTHFRGRVILGRI